MTHRAAFGFSMACLVFGWLAGGLVEFYRLSVWTGAVLLVVVLLAAAAVFDWMARRARRRP